jgi:transcriptional regulator with XRE-family HTH domain
MAAKNIIGPSLRRARNQRRWSQSDLATKLQVAGLDISRSGVGKIEARLRGVNDRELIHILVVFKFTLEELVQS